MVSVERVFAEYRESVALVAASAKEQIRWMRSAGYSADELRCGIDDIEILEDRLRVSRMLTGDSILAVRTLLAHLDSMTDHGLWADDDLLVSRPEWTEARRLARKALDQFDLARQDAVVTNDVEWVERTSRAS